MCLEQPSHMEKKQTGEHAIPLEQELPSHREETWVIFVE